MCVSIFLDRYFYGYRCAFSLFARNIKTSSVHCDYLIGDRKTYQMDPASSVRQAMAETRLDVEEGADIVMVKPAMSYLDLVREVADTVQLPVAAYSVSGEYAMVKAGAKLGYIEEDRIVCEMAVSAYRAGAEIYLTYFAKELAKFMDEGRIG